MNRTLQMLKNPLLLKLQPTQSKKKKKKFLLHLRSGKIRKSRALLPPLRLQMKRKTITCAIALRNFKLSRTK